MKFIVALIAAVSAQCVLDADADGFEDPDNTVPCPLPECTVDAVDDGTGAWAETDGTACEPAAADPPADPPADDPPADDGADDAADAADDAAADLGLGCESAEDCDEEMVCATTTLESTDTEHDDFDEATDAITQEMFPISLCVTQEVCDEMAGEEQEDSPYTVAISCGATKLVAGFAALALASAM